MNCHSELMEDSLRNIEPVQLEVEQMCQASVELPSITDNTGCLWGGSVPLPTGKRVWGALPFPTGRRVSREGTVPPPQKIF